MRLSYKYRRVLWFTLILVTSVLLISLTSYRGSSKELAKPSVTLSASTTSVVLPCPPGQTSQTCPTVANLTVGLVAVAADFKKNPMYTYTVTGGKLVGEGANASWDLSGLMPGTYTATVEVRDKDKHSATASVSVTISNCADCKPIFACSTISVSCQDKVKEGTDASFTANVSEATDVITYNWTVSEGSISSGQGTKTITVQTKNLKGKTITATVEVGGLDPACGRTSTGSTEVTP